MSREAEHDESAALRVVGANTARIGKRTPVLVATVILTAVLIGSGCRSSESSRRSRVKTVNITNVRRHLEMTIRTRDQEQTSKVGAGVTKSEEMLKEEAIGFEVEGSMYHPNFLEFSLAGLFGLLQEDFRDEFGGRTRTSSDDGDILEFDLEGRFFKKKPYPGSVFARRYRTLQPRPFLSSLETTTTNTGFSWRLVNPKYPTSLQYVNTTVDLKPLNDNETPGLQENATLRFDTEYRFSDDNVLSLKYENRSVLEEPFSLAYDSDELTLGHKLHFGEKGLNQLDSELVYFDQRGTFEIKRTRWREILRLTHSDNLRSWYQFEYINRTQGSLLGVLPIHEKSYLISGTLEHQWYLSLQSQLYAYAQRQDFDSGLKITRYGLQPSFDYRKKNRWGILLANYRLRLQKEDRQGGSRRLEVVDERVTFRDPDQVVLTNTNIATSTISITDEFRTIVYRPSEDYSIRLVGDRVELERIPTGRIAEGQIVLVDYVFSFGGDFVLDTVAQNLTIRQNFKFGLSPFYRLRKQDQTIDPISADGVRPENITAQTFGIEYDKSPFRFVAEFEDYDSNITPFKSLRLSGDYRRRFASGGTLRLRSRWSNVKRTDQLARETRFFTFETLYRQQISQELAIEAGALYRNESDTLSGNDEGIDVDLGLEWKVRQTVVKVTYEYGRFQDDFSENKHSTLYVQFRREF